jgi:L-rhamnose 1-dehydrogenase
MKSLAVVLGPHGITCNAVLPGTIRTDLNRHDLTADKTAYFENRIPLGRIGEPEDVADVIAFLLSDDARYINGAELLVDGGLFVNLQ